MRQTVVPYASALLAFFWLACSGTQGRLPASPRPSVQASSEYCQMALAALAVTVKKFEEQPLGLEVRCVERVATSAGKIYVDARFTKGDQLELVPEPSCTTDRYVIRFDPKAFVPSPTEEVVLLGLWTQPPTGWEFNAVVESPNWPSRRPGTMSLSQCGSAFGVLSHSSNGWGATIVTPPRSPDAL